MFSGVGVSILSSLGMLSELNQSLGDYIAGHSQCQKGNFVLNFNYLLKNPVQNA